VRELASTSSPPPGLAHAISTALTAGTAMLATALAVVLLPIGPARIGWGAVEKLPLVDGEEQLASMNAIFDPTATRRVSHLARASAVATSAFQIRASQIREMQLLRQRNEAPKLPKLNQGLDAHDTDLHRPSAPARTDQP
jgi:hypothetical protein